MLDGFVAYGVAAYPCFADQIGVLPGVSRRGAAEPGTPSPSQPSPWQLEAPAVTGQQWHTPGVSGYRGQGAAESGAAWP